MAFSGAVVKYGESGRRRRLSEDVSGHNHLLHLLLSSRKMLILALLYLVGNTLSYYSLARIGAGTFVVLGQGKTMTTALFSSIMLKRQFTWTKWRALLTLVVGVILFILPTFDKGRADGETTGLISTSAATGAILAGCAAQIVVITISGYAAIYFERTIKTDPTDIWERNFQLSAWSILMYVLLMVIMPPEGGVDGSSRFLSSWTPLATVLSIFGACGGLLIALSIKYGDSVLKTLAISGGILYSTIVDRFLLGGPLTFQMGLAAIIVISSIINYVFDASPSMENEKGGINIDVPVEGKDIEGVPLKQNEVPIHAVGQGKYEE